MLTPSCSAPPRSRGRSGVRSRLRRRRSRSALASPACLHAARQGRARSDTRRGVRQRSPPARPPLETSGQCAARPLPHGRQHPDSRLARRDVPAGRRRGIRPCPRLSRGGDVPDEPNVARRDQVRAERNTGQGRPQWSRSVIGWRISLTPFTIAPPPSRSIASPATAATRLSTLRAAGAADTVRRASRPGRAARGGASGRARHGLRGPSGTIPRRAARLAGVFHGSLD